jgi:Ca2+-binding RTX toxin-like protein
MSRKHLFFLMLVMVAALAFGANSAFASWLNFDPKTGVFAFTADDVNDTSRVNHITVHPARLGGFESWTVIEYDYWKTGPISWDQGVDDQCYIDDSFFACPAKAIWIRTAKGDDTITVEPGLTIWALLEGGGGSDTITGGDEHDEIWGACKWDPADQCYGFSDNINGGGGDDFLVGGNETPVFGIADDVIHGGPGDDSLEGGAGHDQLYGDGGTDIAFYGWRGKPVTATLDNTANDGAAGENDYIHHDVEGIQGGAGKDTLFGNDSANVLKGGPGDDSLIGYGGDDKLYGDEGSDLLRGGLGKDTIYGGGDPATSCCSADTATWSERINPITATIDGIANDGEAGEGDFVASDVENLTGGSGNDTLIGDKHGNRLLGLAGNDTLDAKGGGDATGSPGIFVSDNVDGGQGNDLIDGGPAGSVLDAIDGGEGTDAVTYASRSDKLLIWLDGPPNNGEDMIKNVENAKGGEGDDQIVGTDGPNWLYGNGGNDSLNGIGGNDVLHAGDDNDTVYGGAGHDVVAGDDGADTLSGDEGHDYISGHGGLDTVTYATELMPVAVSLDGAYNDGLAGEGDNVLPDVENVIGGAGNDTITGSDGPNTLVGGDGMDTLSGLGGADFLDGGAKNDVLIGGDGPDTLDGGADGDKLFGEGGYDTLRGGIGSDQLDGGADGDTADYSKSAQAVFVDLSTGTSSGEGADTFKAVENAYGSNFADTLKGNSNPNTISGFGGNDTLIGFGGADHLFGADGDDVLRGEAGSDELNGGPGADTADYSKATAAVVVDLSSYVGTATGGADNDWLSLVENINGSPFADTITGSADPNVIKGGGAGDKLFGLGGDDTLNGEAGTDSVDGGANTDACVAETLANCEK